MNNKLSNEHQKPVKLTFTKKNDITRVENFTFSYNPREDRIFFIVNHENPNKRIDFIVTRKMMLQLLEAFDNILINNCDNGKVFKELCSNQETLKVEKPIVKKVEQKNIDIKEDKQELQTVNKSEVRWEKSIHTNDLNFTKTKEPIMLDSLSYSIDKKNLITIKYISSNKIYAISNMNDVVFQRTLSSLMRVIPFMAWGISPHILD
jgi:hypothetical protein